jgi:hypothetical protein
MDHQALIKKEFSSLINEGRTILVAAGFQNGEFVDYPPLNDYTRFRTSALNLVRRSCGSDSDHYVSLKYFADDKDKMSSSYHLLDCLGILEAAQRDFESGLLFDLRSLIFSEVLGDFIEQAEALFLAGYYAAAAVLIGGVLEDTLRKLAVNNNIKIPDRKSLDPINIELARAELYDKLTQKRITALADLRNTAAHGHFDKVKKDDVEDMINWVRRFTADYLK